MYNLSSMMTQNPGKNKFIYFFTFVLLFLLIAPFILFYSFGYNLGSNFSFFKTGGVYVYSGDTGARLYVNGVLDNTTSIFQHGLLVKGLVPKIYSITLAKDGYIDWKKNIKVGEERVAEAYPFLIPSNINTTKVLPQIPKTSATSSPLIPNPEYTSLLALFEPKPVATSTKILLQKATSTTTTLPSVESRQVEITKDGNSIIAVWKGSSDNTPFYFCSEVESLCKENFTVYTASQLGTFDFYPSRNDVILVVDDSGLSAVELDKRPPQNIFSLYKSNLGTKMDFRIIDNENLVIKEGKNITKLSLIYAK